MTTQHKPSSRVVEAWQPIETAPEDGPGEILIAGDGGYAVVAWSGGRWKTYTEDGWSETAVFPRWWKPLEQFVETSCSSCGHTFGPGNSGYSHCGNHRGKAGTP